MKFAYSSGAYKALMSLGLEKWAVMLPPPTAAAEGIGKAVGRFAQSTDNAVAGGRSALQKKPVMQYIDSMGPDSAAESLTSRWFRGQLMEQADTGSMLDKIRAGAMSQFG